MPPQRLTYRQIADDIEQRIRAGEYPVDSKLPSYAELATIYTVSLATTQRAVGLLHDRRLVVGIPGRGVFVAEPTPDPPNSGG
jgi:GntR family transcriptional regulator